MPTKKTTTKKVSVTKKPSAARKPATKVSKAKSTNTRSSLSRHVGIRREESKFLAFSPNRETLYWIILGVVVILFTVWLMKLQMDIQDMYDQVDANTARLSEKE